MRLTLTILSEQIHKQNLCSWPSATKALPDSLLLLWDIWVRILFNSSLNFQIQLVYNTLHQSLTIYSRYREKQDRKQCYKLRALSTFQLAHLTWIDFNSLLHITAGV